MKVRQRSLTALAVLVLSAPLAAQQSTVPGALPSSQERFPTSRDPSYRPPLTPPGYSGVESEAAAAASVFSGDPRSLEAFFRERRRLQNQRRRETGRYQERELQSVLDQNQDDRALEIMMLRQFGQRSFAPSFGQGPEAPESEATRFTKVGLLALPITVGLSFGALQAVRYASGEVTPPDNGQSWGAFGFGFLFAVWVAWRDYSDLQEMRASEAQSWARRSYLHALASDDSTDSAQVLRRRGLAFFALRALPPAEAEFFSAGAEFRF